MAVGAEMAPKSRTIDPEDRIARRQAAHKIQEQRVAQLREEQRRDREIAAVLWNGKQRREAQQAAVAHGLTGEKRATRRFYVSLKEEITLPCGRDADGDPSPAIFGARPGDLTPTCPA